LLGTQMLSSLRQLLLSTIHTGFDLRDWMVAEQPRRLPLRPDTNEFWIDYFSDTGDAPALVYAIGQVLQAPTKVIAADGAEEILKRGELLVIGGDSAYPVADQPALRERLQAPFVWACEKVHGNAHPPEPHVPVFAIPGNHDYYDELNGFARQFRMPATDEGVNSKKWGEPPPLRMPGYQRTQQATYFALELPHGWHLWGIDLGRDLSKSKPIDTRQQEYFSKLGVPEKLIVVTSVPVAVHRAPVEDLRGAFEQLGLEAAFADGGRLRDGHVRLDLSGDVHLYERYWGENVDDHEPAADRDNAAPVEPRYAAVVSGLGGAFHHPIQVEYGKLGRQAAWPRKDDSAAAVGKVLVRPRKVFQAGSVGVVGALLGVIFYLCGTWADYRLSEGVLGLPRALVAGRNAVAIEALDQFGRMLLVGGVFVVWIVLLVLIRRQTRAIRRLLIADERDQPPIQRAIYKFLTNTAAPMLRWFGANPRVTLSVILQMPWWIALWGSLYGAIWIARRDFFERLSDMPFFGTHIAVAVLLVGCMALPFLTHEFSWRRLVPFLLLGFLHAASQILTPFLWAQTSARLLGPPLVMLVGYWCLRPFFSALIHSRQRRVALTFTWLCLITLGIAAPLLFKHAPHHGHGWGPWVIICAWFVLLNSTVTVAWFQTRQTVRERKESGAEYAYLWPRWTFLAVMIPVQAAALFLMSETVEWTAPPGIVSAIGLVTALICGAIFSCLWLGWYFLVCLQWGWHGNEAGSVARVDDYAELLRIKLTEHEAEVWGLGVKAREQQDGDYETTVRVIDHFKVRAPTQAKGTS
jgi:hypothetical protein